jgi:opacity protein-like surface antigen
MRKKAIIAALAILATAGALAANTISFKMNYVIPKMKSDFWDIEFENMSFARSGFQNTSFGLSYDYFLTRELSLVISLDTYSKTKGAFYKDYVGYTLDRQDWAFPNDYEGEFSPHHSIYTSVTPIQISLKVLPLGRRVKIIPYAGLGAGLYLWSLRMQGDMIDFNDEYYYEDPDYGDIPVYPIYQVNAREGENFGKIAFGYQAFGGLMIPVANRLTLDVEFKASFAKGKMTQGFEGFEPLDLGNYQISLGINYWF